MHVAALDTLSKFDDEARLYERGKAPPWNVPSDDCRGCTSRDDRGLNEESSRRDS